jgi:hypothetical protein
MAIQFRCTQCRHRLSIASRKVGCEVRCPLCNEPLVVPDSDQARAAAAMMRDAPAAQRPTLKDPTAAYGVQGILVIGSLLLALLAFLSLCAVLWNVFATSEPAETQQAQAQTTSAKAPHTSPSRPNKEVGGTSKTAAKVPSNPQSKEPVKGTAGPDSTDAPVSRHVRRQPEAAPLHVADPPKAVDSPVAGEKPAPPTAREFILPLEGLGPANSLEKLQVVRLKAKVSFTDAKNVNDITLMWCWEPHVTMRMEETFREQDLKRLHDLVQEAGESADDVVLKILHQVKQLPELNPKLAQAFEDEVHALLKQRNYKPLFDSVLMLDGNDVFSIFNKRLVLPLKNRQATQVRNLCFALSLSNLLPLKGSQFTIKMAEDAKVRARVCRHFTVNDPQGLKLDLYFDKETTLLTKISHLGHKPGPEGISQGQVLWEHISFPTTGKTMGSSNGASWKSARPASCTR